MAGIENALTQTTMTAEFLRYNRWANLVLLDACLGLSDEQLESGLPGSFGTIYDTFVHIIRSEASYYRRLTKVQLEPPFAWDRRPTLAVMRPYAEEAGSALVAAAEQVDPAGMVEHERGGQVLRYRAATLFIQAVNHGVEHRTNITTILAQLGIEPPDVDGWGYMMAQPGRMGASEQ
jgi:uncharacterized damage-inducible protein DinB